jgi:sacsin
MKVFTFFEKQYEFVPKEYQAGNWIEFLCDLGLRQTLTIDEFKRSCQLISKSHHKNIQGASEVLLDYLFSESARSWHSNQRALSEIGDICFVSVDPLTNYRWIKEPCPSPLYFQKQQIGLTKLNESVISDNAAIIWTVKPVVCLPHSLSSCDDMLFHLGVTVRPTIEDVYKNLKNISSCSNTELATCKKNDQIILESVISKNLNFLFENKATELLLKLSNIPCIPVPVNSTPEMVQLVLVKPIQVVRHISKEDEIFFPYIHQVPSFMNTINDDDLGLLRISKYIEVDTLQRMLQSMHDKGVKLDGKDVNCVRNAILKIKELCHQHSKVIGPLYYPNENLVLKRTTDLVVIDSPRYIPIKSNLSNFLFLLPSISNCSDHELLEYDICLKLPEDIRPKRLSLVCTELLRRTIYSNDDCALSIHFNKLKSMVPYLEETLSKVLINENGSKLLSSYFVQLICHMQIKVVKYLTCEVKLECVTLGDVNVPYLIECNETEDIPVLYVDYDASPNQLMYGTLAHSICIEIARKHNEDPTVYLNAASVISKFLEITAPQDLKEICKIYKLDPPNDINFINDVPALGHKIPNDYVTLIYNADIDYNDFRPEEWVGYAVKEDCIIYAIILYPANDENCSLMRKYCIHDGENEQTVSVIDLYALKVNSSLTATKNEDLLVENAYHELIKIGKLKKESELFTKATNRLYIKYHPDRVSPNRHDLYTKVHKYLSRQIDRLTLGLAVEKPSETAPDDVPPTSSLIDTRSRMLNWIIRTYKESEEARRQINLIQPQGDKVEGRKWLRQAKSDMETMNDLLRLNKPHHCCHIIFLAHQTCEKALKGGMYAHFGINLDIHKHKLSHYANALSSRVGELAQHLDFVKIMDSESYYLKTRYPDQFKPSCPPVEKYRDISKARMIAKEAKEVYTLISNTI